MSYSTLTIQLTNSSSTTLTLATSSFSEAATYIQTIGAWIVDNAGVFYPRTAILSITIS
jgi:hypothetical protein